MNWVGKWVNFPGNGNSHAGLIIPIPIIPIACISLLLFTSSWLVNFVMSSDMVGSDLGGKVFQDFRINNFENAPTKEPMTERVIPINHPISFIVPC